jgi:hypothetical protein
VLFRSQYNITDDVTESIVNEGLDSDSWEQPAPGGTAAARINRMTWNRERNDMKREPLLVGGLSPKK